MSRRYRLWIAAVTPVWVLGACAAAGDGGSTSPSGSMRLATIVELKLGDSPQFAIVPDDDPASRYCVDTVALPEALRLAGARLRFSGSPGPIPDNVRMVCTPLQLDALEPAS